MKHYFTLFTAFLFFVGCHHNHGHANAYMHKMSFEELVERFESPERDKWQKPDAVVAKMGKLQNVTVAEIGAGTGYFTFRLAEKGAQVIAGDVDDRFLNYIESRRKTKPAIASRVKTLKIPMDSPDFPAGGFDKILIVDTYHHIDNRIVYFANLLSKMKKGAVLFVVDFKKGSPVGPPDKMKLTPESIKAELEQSGYHKIEIDNQTLPYQYIITAGKD